MPPIERVKYSSTAGPMPSSGARTDLERAMPAKEKLSSSSSMRHAAQPMTGTAVSAAVNCLKTFVRRLRMERDRDTYFTFVARSARFGSFRRRSGGLARSGVGTARRGLGRPHGGAAHEQRVAVHHLEPADARRRVAVAPWRVLRPDGQGASPAILGGQLGPRSELICRGTPIYGGGSDKVHDERGFIVSIPPCLWGSADDRLRPPPRIHLRSNLLSISRANSTRGVTGYMALWQMRAAFVPPHQQHQRHHSERRSDRRARTEAPPPE